MGRLRSDSSPVSVTSIGHGASIPIRSRAVVPEFPQSMSWSGCLGPLVPQPVTVPFSDPSGVFFRSTCAPSCSTAAMDDWTSSESSTPERCEVPSAMAEKSTAR